MEDAQTGLPALLGEVRYMPIGDSGENLAITAFALRPFGEGAELFASVKNYGETDQDVLFSLYASDNLLEAQALKIAAGEERSLTINGLPNTQVVYFARLTPLHQAQLRSSTDQSLDALELDNSAATVYQPGMSWTYY
jgi:hypothetical protein